MKWLATASVIYTPPSLIAPPPRSTFSFTTARNHVERLYVICPPSVWESLLEGELARVWRWQSPNTSKWFLVRSNSSPSSATHNAPQLYVVLWIFDLLPFFPPFFFLLLLLRTQLFPPTPAELLEKLRMRSTRSAEAVSLSSSLKTTGRFGFAVEGAKGVFASLRTEKTEGSALMRGLHGSAMVGGLAGGLGVGKGMEREREREREPSALAKALRDSSFVASGIASPNARGEGEPMKVEGEREATKEKVEEVAARLRKEPDGDVSAYKVATELTRTFGPLAQDYMGSGADLAEKVKKCDPASTTASAPRLHSFLAVYFFIPTTLQCLASAIVSPPSASSYSSSLPGFRSSSPGRTSRSSSSSSGLCASGSPNGAGRCR